MCVGTGRFERARYSKTGRSRHHEDDFRCLLHEIPRIAAVCAHAASPAGAPSSVKRGLLRDAPKRYERQVLASVAIVDDEVDQDARLSADERLRGCTRRGSRPPNSGLVSRSARGLPSPVVDLVRCRAAEALVRPVRVEQNAVRVQLPLEHRPVERNGDPPRALVLHRANEALDDSQTAVLADRAEPLADAASQSKRCGRRGPGTRSRLAPTGVSRMSRCPARVARRGPPRPPPTSRTASAAAAQTGSRTPTTPGRSGRWSGRRARRGWAAGRSPADSVSRPTRNAAPVLDAASGAPSSRRGAARRGPARGRSAVCPAWDSARAGAARGSPRTRGTCSRARRPGSAPLRPAGAPAAPAPAPRCVRDRSSRRHAAQ